MKTIKTVYSRLVKTLLTAAMFVMLIGISASAANVTVNMTKGSDGVYSYTGVNVNTSDSIFHKITVNKPGLLTVSGSEFYRSTTGSLYYYNMYVDLYDANFKRIDNSSELVNADQNDVAYFGVKKGTYYIKVTGEPNYVLLATFQKTPNKGAAKKAKAFTLKQKKNQIGVMPAGEKASAADWYKFKVTKKKVLYLDISTMNHGYFDFYLYGPSYKKGIRVDSLNNESGSYNSINARTGKKLKVAKGTYYLKVVRTSYSKKASGIYALKWR